MKHLALYRKYRPSKFDEVIGQDHIIKTLKNQVETGQISHAYLFNGTRGTGKTSTAKILAKAINCKEPKGGSPCLTCQVCKALEDPSNLDILEIDAASNNRVDEIRDLREKIKYPPVSGRYKVYIIDEVHMLTDSAFNALLKTLEEPPAHAVFILATTEVHKLPATILSRVMRFDFKLVSINNLIELLKIIFKLENITADADSLKAIAKAGEGSVRDTLSVADVCVSFSGGNITYDKVLEALGTTTKDVLINLASAIITKDSKTLLLTVNDLFAEGKNLGVLARDLTSHFRDLLVIKSIPNSESMLTLPSEVFESMQAQAKLVNETNLLFYMQTLGVMEAELKYSANERLLLETAALSCINQTSIIDALQKRIENLEKGVVQPPEKKLVNEAKAVKQPEVKKAADIVKNTEPVVNKSKAININQVWGKFLLSLNLDDSPVLYTAVADATPVSYEGGIFMLETLNKAAHNALNKQENKKIIEEFLKTKDIDCAIQVILKQEEKKDDFEGQLKQKFGSDLKITD
jgi:DNA polymerase III subunit gamma/tau